MLPSAFKGSIKRYPSEDKGERAKWLGPAAERGRGKFPAVLRASYRDADFFARAGLDTARISERGRGSGFA